MVLPLRAKRDPFWDDGRGARRRNLRVRFTEIAAFGLAVAACGVISAMWLRLLAPMILGAPLG